MAKLWWVLSPIEDDDEPQMAMTFPALISGQYAIVSTAKDVFALGEYQDDTETGATIKVDENGSVRLNVDANSTVFVQVNDQVIENGQSSPTLRPNDRVKLADCQYVVRRIASEAAGIRSAFRQLAKCNVCLRPCNVPRLLKCGHSFCEECLQRMVELAMQTPQEDPPIRLDVAAFGVIEEEELQQQSRQIRCAVCRQPYSCWEANRALRPAALAEAIDWMNKWTDDDTMPKCATCRNDRCFTDSVEYEYCERCKKALCPACAIEGHRDHELRDRKVTVKTMHEFRKRVVLMRSKLLELRQKEKAAREKCMNIGGKIWTLQDHAGTIIGASVRACDRTLDQIERQFQPFASTDATLVAEFDQGVNTTREKMDLADRVAAVIEKSLKEAYSLFPANQHANNNST